MKKLLVYEDASGYCRIVSPTNDFQGSKECDEEAINRLHQNSIPSVCEFFVVDPEKIPKDRTFRDAWKKGDKDEPVRVDFDMALEIHRKRIQEACEKKISQLNKALEIAIEDDHLPRQVAITRTKKIIRTLHDMNLTHCKTVDDIKNSVPQELHDVWSFYLVG